MKRKKKQKKKEKKKNKKTNKKNKKKYKKQLEKKANYATKCRCRSDKAAIIWRNWKQSKKEIARSKPQCNTN